MASPFAYKPFIMRGNYECLFISWSIYELVAWVTSSQLLGFFKFFKDISIMGENLAMQNESLKFTLGGLKEFHISSPKFLQLAKVHWQPRWLWALGFQLDCYFISKYLIGRSLVFVRGHLKQNVVRGPYFSDKLCLFLASGGENTNDKKKILWYLASLNCIHLARKAQ